MKRYLLFFVVLAFTFSAKSQVIDTTIQSIVAFNVTPIKVNMRDTLLTNRVGIRVLGDDFKGSLTVYVQLMNSSQQTLNGITFNRVIPVSSWNEVLTGTDYGNYDGSPEYIAKYLSRKYGFVF